jgi:hypothetical protein
LEQHAEAPAPKCVLRRRTTEIADVEKKRGKRWSKFTFEIICINRHPNAAEYTPALRDRQLSGRMADAV